MLGIDQGRIRYVVKRLKGTNGQGLAAIAFYSMRMIWSLHKYYQLQTRINSAICWD